METQWYGSFGQAPAAGVETPRTEAQAARRQQHRTPAYELKDSFPLESQWPTASCAWWSRLVFGNVSFLFAIAKTRPLTLQDVQQWQKTWTSAGHALTPETLCQLYYDGTHLLAAIWRMEWKRLVLSAWLMLVSIPCALAPVVLLYIMLTSLVWQHHNGMQMFACLGGFFLFNHLVLLMRSHAMMELMRISRRVAAVCKSLVLQSALENACGNTCGIAEMTSLNTSVEALMHWICELHGGWVALLELAGQIYILNRVIKAQLLVIIAGLLVFIAMVMLATSVENRCKQNNATQMTSRWKAINECFRGVQAMKLNAWEEKFEKKINDARATELQSVFWMQGAQGVRMALSWCQEELSVAAAFVVFAWEGRSFDPAFSFSVLVLSQQMKRTLTCIVQSSLILRGGLNAINSIEEHLNRVATMNEQNRIAIRTNAGKYTSTAVVATHAACFGYGIDKTGYILMNVSVGINKGELVVVHGKAGQGKTTLLTALIRETKCMNGEVFVSSQCRVAYCSQQPWVQSLTIRDNILFGSPYDESRYFAVLDACCLIDDLSVLPNGDSTVIGPRGINLSGGQQARIALARACYADADLYVLDCPLASVDAVVQMDVFRKCIVEMLRYKTVLLATHNSEFIHSGMVDRLLEVSDKTVSEQGWDHKPEDASHRVKEYESSFWDSLGGPGKAQGKVPSARSLVLGDLSPQTKSMLKAMQGKVLATNALLMEDSIDSLNTLRLYFTMGNRVLLAVGCLFVFCYVALLIAKNFWLASWTSAAALDPVSSLRGAVVYATLVLGAFCALLVAIFFVSYSTNHASDGLFHKMLHAILYAPFSFFYWIPTGEVLGRFFVDMRLMDHAMMGPTVLFCTASSALLGTFFVLWFLLGWIGVALVLFALRFVIKTRVINVFVSVKLLEVKNDSNDFTNVSEALEGMSVIRAFGASTIDRFVAAHRRCIEDSHRLSITGIMLNYYETLNLSLLQGLALAILLACDYLGTLTNAAQLGLSMIYILNLPSQAMKLVTGWYKIVIRLISVKRLLAFCAIQCEEHDDHTFVPGRVCHDPKGWLSCGRIVFDRVWFRYSVDDSTVYALKNVSFSIAGSSKIGVVGRTGSGKSSIAMALFRAHELVRGRIVVDNVDIRSLPLQVLRRHMCIIPQSPMFYRSTVREYLDPFDEFASNDLWQMIHKVGLSSFVQSLQTELQENGENWSLGQRQLLCLARSLLRPSKIVILDEPFSSIDGESDKQLLNVLSSELRESTVLFVTHRLDQVLTFCEKILVLKDGEVEDFGVVEELVGRSDGVFFELLENTLLTR